MDRETIFILARSIEVCLTYSAEKEKKKNADRLAMSLTRHYTPTVERKFCLIQPKNVVVFFRRFVCCCVFPEELS